MSIVPLSRKNLGYNILNAIFYLGGIINPLEETLGSRSSQGPGRWTDQGDQSFLNEEYTLNHRGDPNISSLNPKSWTMLKSHLSSDFIQQDAEADPAKLSKLLNGYEWVAFNTNKS